MQRYFSLATIFCFFPLLVIANSVVINLIDIKVSSDSEQEHILLVFDQSLQNTPSPSLNFETGVLRVTLPKTLFTSQQANRRVNDRFIQGLQLNKEGNGSILEIQFANSEFDPIGRVSYKIEDQNLHIDINKKEVLPPSEIESGNDLFQKINQQKTTQQNSFLEGNFLEDSDITTNIIKMVVALFFLLLFLYALLWLYNKFFVSKFRYNKGKYSIQVSASYHLSPKQKIVVMEVNDRAFACGVTPNQISVISEISDDSFMNFVSEIDLADKKTVNFGALRTQYLESRKQQEEKKTQHVKGERSFSAELIKRVKKLRPLD